MLVPDLTPPVWLVALDGWVCRRRVMWSLSCPRL
jgi:hypothetical protein